MMKPRNLLCLLVMLVFAALAPAGAMAVDETPDTSTTVPSLDGSAPSTTDVAPVTIDPAQLEAIQDQADTQDEDKNVFEKASDFVTDNAPWFIIGIIVLAAIAAGILIMRGRPRKKGAAKPAAAATVAAGAAAAAGPSASELRRRKRAAVQRQREEERMRRKAGAEARRAAPPGVPVAPVPPGVADTPGYVDPVEAEKQGAKDQQTAAAAVARFGGAVPAPISPSQTAPAAGVVLPESAVAGYAPVQEPDTIYEPAADIPEQGGAAEFSQAHEPMVEPEADTGVVMEPSLESPGPDGTVGEAAGAFLAGGAAGAAGGFTAARAGQSAEEPEVAHEDLDSIVEAEPGLSPEYMVADAEPFEEQAIEDEEEEFVAEEVEPAGDPVEETAAADDRLSAKVAEIKATQEPAPVADEPEIRDELQTAATTPEPAADLSPGLASVERQLSAKQEECDRVLREAEERLRQIEQRAEDAERRAAFAERLAQLKIEESERERRLNKVVSGIDRAEQRALEAEARAEAAEKAAAAALEQSELRLPGSSRAEAPEPVAPVTESPAVVPQVPAPPEPQPVVEPVAEPELPQRRGFFGGGEKPTAPAETGMVSLNQATFEELREAGLSVTQATRILAYRERFGGYDRVEDLEKVPGFPADLIESLSSKLSI